MMRLPGENKSDDIFRRFDRIHERDGIVGYRPTAVVAYIGSETDRAATYDIYYY